MVFLPGIAIYLGLRRGTGKLQGDHIIRATRRGNRSGMKPTKGLKLALSLAWVLGVFPVLALATPAAQPQGPAKIEQALWAQLASTDTVGYLIYFGEEPDLSPAYQMNWHDRGWFVMKALQDTAERAQAGIRSYLDAQEVTYQAFWIDNVIAVEGSSSAVLLEIANLAEIEMVRSRRTMNLIEPMDRTEATSSPEDIEPNISHVGAPDLWAMGYTGDGIVVATIDTGVRFSHQALVGSYRGNLGGGTFDHDYNWLDPDTGYITPYDDQGHGSHTMGIMIGDDGGSNHIGMAPGAQWIACDACHVNAGCPDAALLTCAQWIAAPYPIGSPRSPDPDMRPHVVNNSWGDCGQVYDDWYQDAIDAWHAAGIYPIFSNNNANNCDYAFPPGCNTVGNPARYGNVTGVGSTYQTSGQYAAFSNWGPTDAADTVNPRGYPYLKPQVLAPGVNIRSSLRLDDNHYGQMSGTSMSAPHVSGLIALLWQAAPCLVGDYASTETIVEQTAVPVPYSSDCGGEGPDYVPNQAAGWGEIDAPAAAQAAKSFCEANIRPQAQFTWMPTPVYTDTLVQFHDDSTGPVEEWLWQVSDGAEYSTQNPIHTFAASGVFAVSLSVTTGVGYTDTTSRQVIVHRQGFEPPTIYVPFITKGAAFTP